MGAPSGVSRYIPSGVINYGVVIIVAIAALWVVSGFVFKSASQDIAVTTAVQIGNPTTPPTLNITKEGTLRIKPGGEYTFSFWVYINSWSDGTAKVKSVLNIKDAGVVNNTLLSVLLYPADPKMAIRLYTENASSNDLTLTTRRAALSSGSGSTTQMSSPDLCDITGIDLQRWLNITVCTNGRIVDIYYDGKLNRSCVLPGMILAGSTGLQSVTIGESGGFQGSLGVMNYYAYALTPDRIYSIYLAGPGGPPSILGYLESKFGLNLNLTYTK